MMSDEVKATTTKETIITKATTTTTTTTTTTADSNTDDDDDDDNSSYLVNEKIDMFDYSNKLLSVSKLANLTTQQHLKQQQKQQGEVNNVINYNENNTTSQLLNVSPLTISSASMLSSPFCPSMCQCKWRSGKKTVLCESASLTSIPNSIESDTQVLNLNENDLNEFLTKTSTSFSSLGLTNLQRIYLAR